MFAIACSVYDPSLQGETPSDPDDGAAGGPVGGPVGSGGTDPLAGLTAMSAGVGSAAVGSGGPVTGGGGAAGNGNAGGGSAGGAPPGDYDAAPDVGASAGGASVDAGVPMDTAPEASCPNATLCALKSALVHRYSFGGTGRTVIDSIGSANGTVVNGQLSGNGTVVLPGGSGDRYVDLPNGIITQLTNVSLETWVKWDGGVGWQRLFDFGNTDSQGLAASSFYLTPQGAGPTTMVLAFKRADQMAVNETRAISRQPLSSSTTSHLVAVLDVTNRQMTLYRDGAIDTAVPLNDTLSALTDVNNRLGRSQYTNDPPFSGTFDEFRIYRVALSEADVRASLAAGPNPPYLN